MIRDDPPLRMLALTADVPRRPGTRSIFFEHDLLVGKVATSEGAVRILAIALNVNSRDGEWDSDARVLVHCNGAGGKLRCDEPLVLEKVDSVVTLSREFAAVIQLKQHPLQDYVYCPTLRVKAPPTPVRSSRTMDTIKRTYNGSQVAAIEHVLSDPNPFQFIQGPPGTGKTKTIIGLLSVILAQIGSTAAMRSAGPQYHPPRILLCAPSHAAVDEILLRVIRGQLMIYGDRDATVVPSIVRVGQPENVDERVRCVHIDNLAAAGEFWSPNPPASASEKDKDPKRAGAAAENPLTAMVTKRARLEVVRKEVQQLQRLAAADPDHARRTRGELNDLVIEQLALLKAIDELGGAVGRQRKDNDAVKSDLMRRANIVGCTLAGAGADLLSDYQQGFDYLIVDEACQAVEAACLIPLRYQPRKYIYVGDPRQLPAVLFAKSSLGNTYSTSIFDRFAAAGVPVQMLSVQYRMHPLIAEFPSRMFYDGQLKNGENTLLPSWVPPYSSPATAPSLADAVLGPICFVDVERPSGSRGSRYDNEDEAKVTAAICRRMLQIHGPSGFRGSDIAVLTFYNRQKTVMSKQLATMFTGERPMIEVSSVDGFQGREADVIIISCVRSRDGVGFLADMRRLNVAITRAKKALIIVGNQDNLVSNKGWKDVLDFYREKGRIVVVKDPNTLAGEAWALGRGTNPPAPQAPARPAKAPERPQQPAPARPAPTNLTSENYKKPRLN